MVATTLATVGVGWLAFATLESAVIAGGGAYPLAAGPLAGFAIGSVVFRALRARCA